MCRNMLHGRQRHDECLPQAGMRRELAVYATGLDSRHYACRCGKSYRMRRFALFAVACDSRTHLIAAAGKLAAEELVSEVRRAVAAGHGEPDRAAGRVVLVFNWSMLRGMRWRDT